MWSLDKGSKWEISNYDDSRQILTCYWDLLLYILYLQPTRSRNLQYAALIDQSWFKKLKAKRQKKKIIIISKKQPNGIKHGAWTSYVLFGGIAITMAVIPKLGAHSAQVKKKTFFKSSITALNCCLMVYNFVSSFSSIAYSTPICTFNSLLKWHFWTKIFSA